jgi:hypothetical protein
MDNEKWPAFITGFVLGVLVAGGVIGTFAWRQHQQAIALREESLALREHAEAAERMAQEEARRAMEAAEREARLKHQALENERKARKALEEALNNIKLKAAQPGDKDK